jgi:aminocarboxymuconate-semialdehyde decarboxylase
MRIDFPTHCYPAQYLDLLDRYGGSACGTAAARDLGAEGTRGELDARFSMMADAGADVQVLSVSPQDPYFDSREYSLTAATLANDLYAELVQTYPDRFRALACLPLPHVAAALEELSRALEELKMVGVAIATSVQGRSIADPAFEPLWAELDQKAALLFIHPTGIGAGARLLQEHNLTWPIGAPVEDTMAIGHLMGAGITRRYPNVRIAVCHL